MPDRIIRAGILTSDTVNTLSWQGEVFYRRLMSVADDYGRYDGRNSILRANLYPLKLDRVSDSDVGKWKGECSEAGLVRCYLVNGKEYVEIARFDQRLRAATSKWPAPPSDADTRGHPRASADIGEHPPSNASESEADSETTNTPSQPAREATVTLAEALEWAKGATVIIAGEVVEAWHDDRSRGGWTFTKGESGIERDIRDWRADLRTYARSWGNIEAQRRNGAGPKQPPGGNGSSKPESAWALRQRIEAAEETRRTLMGMNRYKNLPPDKKKKVDDLNESIRGLKEKLAACPES